MPEGKNKLRHLTEYNIRGGGINKGGEQGATSSKSVNQDQS
jgi:hypothetical protein